MDKQQVYPFLKWAGGKSKLLRDIDLRLPEELKKQMIDRYIEPFVGGGAVLFHILNNYNVKDIYIYDTNKELINTYEVVKYKVDELINELMKIQTEYISLNEEERKDYYYKQRTLYNEKIKNSYNYCDIDMASKFIFLNKTCFNGLYRVNKDGLFNVPIGRYKNPKICDKENLETVSDALQSVHIEHNDYKGCEKNITDNTFVYFDPPYRPISKTASFTAYAKDDFNDDNQKELAEFYSTLHSKGATLMLSISNPKETDSDDTFFHDMYSKFYIDSINANRVINSDSSKRGFISELLIVNY